MTTTLKHAKNGGAVLSKCLHVLKHRRGSITSVRRRAWYSEGTPAVDTSDRDSYPVAVGDLVIQTSLEKVYVCKVAPTVNTAAFFTEIPG